MRNVRRVALDRYTAPNESFAPVVRSRIAVLGARSAPKDAANQPRVLTGVARAGPWLVLVVGLLAWRGAIGQEATEIFQGEEVEQFLLEARVTDLRAIGQGVTLPRRATLELDGVTQSAAFKTIDVAKSGVTQFAQGGGEINFQDSWRTEIPGYVVDRIIGLGMVPATVERNINGQVGSLQFWVTSMMPEAQRVRKKVSPPDTEAWNRLMFKVRLFDNLIYNTDRHLNNILVTKDFQIRLIDHSRSFRSFEQLRTPEVLPRFSRSLLEGLQKLEEKDLTEKLGRNYLTPFQIRALLKRRDAIVELARKRVAERGEAAVLYP
ncbi:MAG: hypothetical protein ACRD3C_25560 [Vicinamibacterales bacterium]